jgi:AraC-like DNA-binding protein
MPLFMDIHKFDAITIEDVKKAHEVDKAIQAEYGVKYHQFWVNERQGFVFCLVEGPTKEACIQVHQYAHGFVACNIVEVEPGFFKLFMGDGLPVEHGLVQNDEGKSDPGYRHIMIIDLRGKSRKLEVENIRNMLMPQQAKNLVLDRIARFNGRVVEIHGNGNLVGVFDTSVNAIRCAKDLRTEIITRREKSDNNGDMNVSFKIGLQSGHPLTEDAGFFTKALTQAQRLCITAKENEVLVSSFMAETCSLEDTASLRSVTQAEELFITKLFDITVSSLSDKNFNIDHLSRKLGVSRAQLYRKTMSLTGRSPNGFISSLRMDRALDLMKNNFGNISQVALEVGYQSPSYFSKCFLKNYGFTPSQFYRTRANTGIQ